jgi:phage-related protein
MADGIELGKAYVQIVPSAKGIKDSIAEELGGESARAGESAGQLFTGKLVGTIKTVLGTAAIGKMISDSVNAGGALQQSLGGIETLFKDRADKVKTYAAQAYKTAGLSANDYIESTTSFAASLLSSVSQDTDAAAQLANMAMVDMSDNANKMSTSMQDIQNAYQGFAKQNYTMLDNLKLGYGGTQAEMQRLLKDAEKISGVKYDLGNLADMYSAIHVIQTELDITGTTAREATTTLTGSFASMKAAAQNVLGQMALGEDLQPSLEALVEAARTYLVDNLLPLVVNAVGGIPEAIAALAPAILQTGTELLQNLTSGFAAGIPDFLSQALPAVLSFTEELRANFGDFVSAGIDLILSLANGLVEGLPQLFAYIPDIVINIAGLINDNAPKILAGAVGLMVQLGKGLIDSIPLIIQNLSKIVEAIVSVISAFNWLNLGANILKGLASGIKSMASSVTQAMKQGISGAISWIKSLPGQAVQWGKNLIQSFISGLNGTGTAATIATAGIQVAKTAAQPDTDWTLSDDVVDKAEVNAFRMQNLAKQVEDTIPAYTKSGDAAAAAAQKAGSAAKTAASVVNSYSDTAYEVVGNTKRTIQTINEELSNGTTQQKQTITSTSREMVDGVLKDVKTVETIAADGKRTVSQTMETVRDVVDTVTASSTAIVDGIKTTTQTVTKTLADGTTEQQRVITQTQDKVIDGALRTVETVKTIAADGTEQVAETIKESSAKTLDGLWSALKDRANEGILGTVDTLWEAVKSGDWVGIGKWAASALYSGLTANQKQQIWDFAMKMVDGLNGVLGDAAGSLAQAAWSIGQTLFEGITGKFGDISSMAVKMGGTLKSVFGALKAPLTAAAKAISAGLSGGLLSMFPAIYAGFAGMIGTIGAAVEGMLAAISAALTSTLFGIPAGLVVAAAAVALGVAIAAIVSKLGGSRSGGGSSSGGGVGGGLSSGLDLDTPSITDGSNKLTDTIDANTAKLTEINKSLAKLIKSANALVLSDNMAVSSRVAASGTAQIAAAAGSYREGDTNITQNIYSKAHTAADLQREARWEADRAKAQKH